MVIDFIRKMFAFLSSLWALADIVLDIVTVIRYRDLCQVTRLSARLLRHPVIQEDEISCSYYQLGILFMVLPVAIAILFFTVLLVRESGEFESVLEYFIIILIFGVFYLLVVPIVSIWFTARALVKNTDSDDRDMDMVKVLKLFEHIGEALPQLVLSCIFIASNGGPWVSTLHYFFG